MEMASKIDVPILKELQKDVEDRMHKEKNKFESLTEFNKHLKNNGILISYGALRNFLCEGRVLTLDKLIEFSKFYNLDFYKRFKKVYKKY